MSSMKLTFTPKTKVCSCCGQEKPEYDYYKQSYTGILDNQCKECVKIKQNTTYHKAKVGKFISKERQRGMEEPDYSFKDWQDVMLFFGAKCPICGCKEGKSKKEKFDKDHIVALSRGGKTIRNNIMPCCKRDNRARGNRDIFEWFREQPTWTQDREDKIREWMLNG